MFIVEYVRIEWIPFKNIGLMKPQVKSKPYSIAKSMTIKLSKLPKFQQIVNEMKIVKTRDCFLQNKIAVNVRNHCGWNYLPLAVVNVSSVSCFKQLLSNVDLSLKHCTTLIFFKKPA